MLAHGTLRQRQYIYNLSTNAFIFFSQHFQNGNSCRVRNCFGKFRQGLFLFSKCRFFIENHRSYHFISQIYDQEIQPTKFLFTFFGQGIKKAAKKISAANPIKYFNLLFSKGKDQFIKVFTVLKHGSTKCCFQHETCFL